MPDEVTKPDDDLNEDSYREREIAKLEAQWGERISMRYQANYALADWASRMLGCPQTALAELEEHLGFAGITVMFHRIAKEIMEPIWRIDNKDGR